MKFEYSHIIDHFRSSVKATIVRDDTAIYTAAFFDSRECIPGSIFIALNGESTQGKKFVHDAITKGAACVIASENDIEDINAEVAEFSNVCDFIFVDNPLAAFGKLGALARNQFHGSVIGVIGSVGKTTTKNMLCELGGGSDVVNASRASYNNETGVPLTLCEMNDSASRSIIEMGESNFGDLDYIAKIARPTHLVITFVGQAHIEFLGDTAGVAQTMNEAVLVMGAETTIILPANIEQRDIVLGNTSAQIVCVVDATSVEQHDIPETWLVATVTSIESRDDLTHDVEMDINGFHVGFHVPLVGRHFVMNAALAMTASVMCGDEPSAIAPRMENVVPQGHRMRVVSTDVITLFDDCYNANPESVKASMDVLSAYAKDHKKRSVFFFGPMRELGTQSDSSHIELANYAKESNIDVLVCVKSETKPGYEARKADDGVYYCDEVSEAVELIDKIVQHGDVVGVKASRGPDPHRPALLAIVESLEAWGIDA